jgi:EAL domain-containing protein (putative c-di-GMP-specific phosphodiesterase class I)
MAVNVSAIQFHRPDFVDRCWKCWRRPAQSPERLKLELTESLLVKDVEGTIAKMSAARDRRQLSLDDFGTGYSSLSYLHRLPLDQLKIDQSFVRDALKQAQHGAVIARTILALGKALDLAVLAEGVETAEQHAFIIGAGCRAYQGYLFSRPLPEDQLATLFL